MSYYDAIAEGYDELHEEEQLVKIRLIKKYLAIPKSATLLDVGCGSGISTVAFGCTATGIDPSKGLIAIARKKRPGPTYIVGKAEALPFDDHSFDYVISLTALQNFDDLEKGLLEIRRVGNCFALSFLRGNSKEEYTRTLIQKYFSIKKVIEEQKDVIVLAD